MSRSDDPMRKIDPNNFRIATRGTPRQINRQIALNLVRTRPISRADRALSDLEELGQCDGVGIVVPGMVDPTGTPTLFAPRLGWHDLPLLEPLEAALGLPVSIENSGRACALAHLWATRGGAETPDDFIFVSVSDGLGVGVIVRGELLRGQHNVAGEFGHMALTFHGPRCACGVNGCSA